ncbi:MAG TPA: CPXCG motif-containing cysteine-rich protein [Rhodanobacteraceae bacterium]|nr:CPXCG motif-containing cysteine-rich protein [Rhodanobacteraceae bacterium]
MLETVAVTCPYCGEPIELGVDTSAGSTTYVEDCPVCCQPMQVDIEVDGAMVSARARTGDE